MNSIMKKIYYEKIGRRYVPVSEYDSDLIDAFPKGAHLVITTPGCRSTHYRIDPAYAPMIAAGHIAEQAISDAIRKELDLRPSQSPITEEQRDAWIKLAQSFGDEIHTLSRGSARDAAEAGVRAMQAEADRIMSNAAVKQAYDNFLLMCKLVEKDATWD